MINKNQNTSGIQFDTRLYRALGIGQMSANDELKIVSPYHEYGSWVKDWYETPESIQQEIEFIESSYGDAARNDSSVSNTLKGLEEKKKFIERFIKSNKDSCYSYHSLVHPYALIRLAGASGNKTRMNEMPLFDRGNKRKFYEVDGGELGGYAKFPTTTSIIHWGNSDEKGRTPYSFQDFVFCKHWNKIENNRLITLRRYAAPVTDNMEFQDFTMEDAKDPSNKSEKEIRRSKRPFSPLATAVTYFGEGTGNELSSLLEFSAGYKWEKIGTQNGQKDPMEISSEQLEGSDLVNDKFAGISHGLSTIGRLFGIFADVYNGQSIQLEAAPQNLPPDPYQNGPYENRILGPINVITETYRRNRGLKFEHNSLKITFDYVSRPIAGINNKAILLDLLSNILVMSYSSGSWFGGMWRFRTDDPKVYPFKYGDAMTKLYQGNLFGKDGAVSTLTQHAMKEDGKNLLMSFIPDLASVVKNLFNAAVDAANGAFAGGKDKEQKRKDYFDSAKNSMQNIANSSISKTVQKIISTKLIAGKTVPYIKGQRALLTGEPVGDWHLTIGNPLNPIAMIGNLIVDDVSIKFYDELGPDDFPIGFKATISLKHGLGRDRDAIESMFNRGTGRIYTLSSEFRSSADGETKVDAFTGGVNTEMGRTQYEEIRNVYFGGGYRFIAKQHISSLHNSGQIWDGNIGTSMIKATDAGTNSTLITSQFLATPWQMGMTL